MANKKQPSALEQIKAHRKQQELRPITCDLITGVNLFVKPLQPEHYLEAMNVNKLESTSARTRAAAKLIVENVVEEDGRPAFLSAKGSAVEDVATCFPPKDFWALFGQVFEPSVEKEVEELGKRWKKWGLIL